MRKNVRFRTSSSQDMFNERYYVAENEYETFFVLYLAIDRSDDIIVNPYQIRISDEETALSEVNADQFGTDALSNVDSYFIKTYDGNKVGIDFNIIVSDFTPKNAEQEEWNGDSSNGQIINVKEYITKNPGSSLSDNDLYFKKELLDIL